MTWHSVRLAALQSFLILILVQYCAGANLQAQDANDHLLADWGGLRTQLQDQGVTVELILTHDLMSVTSGGLRQGTFVLGNLDLTVEVDTKQAGVWENGSFFFYVLGDYGRDPSSYSSEIQVTNNIESFDTIKLYEAWYEHSFMDDLLSLRAGLHDLNSEFYALDYASLFINSSFGIGVDLAQVGPSIFNTTAPALRIKAVPGDESYIQGAVYDGIPGDPNNPRGTQIKIRSEDGVFYIAEVGLIAPEETNHYKLGLGVWHNTAKFEDFTAQARDRNSGGYVIAESHLFGDGENSALAGFLQLGFAKPTRNQVGQYIGVGLNYSGVFCDQARDNLGFGIANALLSEDFRDANPGSKRSESIFELTYHYYVTPYFAVQPDIQYIVNPGADAELDDAVVVGMRTELAL